MPGSFEHKGTDKHGVDKWLMIVSDGLTATGKQKKFTRMFHGSKPAMLKELPIFYTEVKKGQARRKSGLLVREWADEFLLLCQRKDLAARTIAGYRQHLERSIKPALGNIHLSKLTPKHIRQYLAMLEEEPIKGPRAKYADGATMSGSTRLRHFATLSTMLQEAVYHEKVPHNPARDVRPPRAEKKRARFVDTPQQDRLLQAIAQETPRNYTLVILALGMGLRRGELAALRWEHIDWTTNTITIEHAVEYIAGEGQHIKSPKSDSGTRILAMPSRVRQALEYCLVQQHLDKRASLARKKQKRPWRDSGYIFTRKDSGERLHIEYISTQYKEFIANHNLPNINLHGLRHTAISIWLAGGLSATDVAALAGDKPATTTNHYSHAFTINLARSSDIMEEVLSTKLSTNSP